MNSELVWSRKLHRCKKKLKKGTRLNYIFRYDNKNNENSGKKILQNTPQPRIYQLPTNSDFLLVGLQKKLQNK